MATIHPAEPTFAFWTWAKCLAELINWAREPDPETTSRDGWREAFKNDIRDKGNRAQDAATDSATRNQVSRSRSLAVQLVRMLSEWTEVNGTPCVNWSHVDLQVVNQLADLQSRFALLGDGSQKGHAAVLRLSTKPRAERDDTPTEADLIIAREIFGKATTMQQKTFNAAAKLVVWKASSATKNAARNAIEAERRSN